MPIKFRCSYCRQFLGISRARAGGVVDCPTCGRSIRVPTLEGVVQPVPSPELNLQDTKLVRALDELANWDAVAAVPSAAAEQAEAEVEIPQPLAEPIPIEVPVAPEPVAVKPPPTLESAPQESVSKTPEAAAEPSMNVAAALAELNQLAAVPPVMAPPRDAFVPTIAAAPAPPRWGRWFGGIGLAVGLSFLAGFAIARSLQPTRSGNSDTVTTTAEAPPATAISGRISWKTADGSSLPDKGARILILPREREGSARLSAVGFRPDDHPADMRLAVAALRALGGDLALTNDGGEFAVQLANPGTFHIVVISNYARRGPGEETDAELLRQLSLYFDQPAQVTGRTKVHFGQVRYKGTATELWDHSF